MDKNVEGFSHIASNSTAASVPIKLALALGICEHPLVTPPDPPPLLSEPEEPEPPLEPPVAGELIGGCGFVEVGLRIAVTVTVAGLGLGLAGAALLRTGGPETPVALGPELLLVPFILKVWLGTVFPNSLQRLTYSFA